MVNGLKVALCQMKVVPGRPDLNAAYVIKEIEEAGKRGQDLIVFPEMCVTGYIVADIFEDDYFIEDVLRWNKRIVEATNFTQRYLYLEKYLLSKGRPAKQRIAVFGGSFNPSAMNHKLIVEKLSEAFDLVVVVPCGIRTDKPSTAIASPEQRKEMAIMTFRGMPKVELDFYDLDNNIFTPTYLLQERYQERFPDSEIWFAIGDDLVAGGRDGKSEIQKTWIRGQEIWRDLRFVVVTQPGKKPDPADLPPLSEVLEIAEILGRSTTVRERASRGESIDGLVVPEVAEYIATHQLYK